MDTMMAPIRMTRARAAARAEVPSVNNQSTPELEAIGNRASQAPATTYTSKKRKTRVDSQATDVLQQSAQPVQSDTAQVGKHAMKGMQSIPKPTRGRPRKIIKMSASDPILTDNEPRQTKAMVSRQQNDKQVNKQPAQIASGRATRARAAARQNRNSSGDKSTQTHPSTTHFKTALRGLAGPNVNAVKTGLKKTVKFADPDKENIAPRPVLRGKAAAAQPSSSATGLQAKPLRAAASSGLGGKGAPKRSLKVSSDHRPIPLSPKKILQAPRHNEPESEDELAMMPEISSPYLSRSPRRETAISSILRSPVKEEAKTQNGPNHPSFEGTVRRWPSSPFKDSMKSPPKKINLVLGAPDPALAGTSALYATLSALKSPAKRPCVLDKVPINLRPAQDDPMQSPTKMSLLQSPARRQAKTFTIISPLKDDITIAKRLTGDEDLEKEPSIMPVEYSDMPAVSQQIDTARAEKLLTLEADPAVVQALEYMLKEKDELEIFIDATSGQPREEEKKDVDSSLVIAMQSDAVSKAHNAEEVEEGKNQVRLPQSEIPVMDHGLRQKDMDDLPDDATDSEDESIEDFRLSVPSAPTTPCPASCSRAVSVLDGSQLTDYTLLASKFEAWSAVSPSVRGRPVTPIRMSCTISAVDYAAVPTTTSLERTTGVDEIACDTATMDDPIFEDVDVIPEDGALAAEADEISARESLCMTDREGEEWLREANSEMSTEYGDENVLPIDLSSAAPPVPQFTPQRVLFREFHTTSKVPLKAPADVRAKPAIFGRRRSTNTSIADVKPDNRPRPSTDKFSFSPARSRSRPNVETPGPLVIEAAPSTPVTPAKSKGALLEVMTPGWTPRSDRNKGLFKGMVVHVDVHTSEGADASDVFYELLAQMGARCLKQWNWHPAEDKMSLNDAPASVKSAATGVTHVIFKDGGKRTLQKIRESRGAVRCVGVSWVLDCERENEWLDETPYQVDIAVTPRGGRRRRKSMEPRTLPREVDHSQPSVYTPDRATKQPCPSTLPASPPNRRDSTLWMHTTGDEDADGEEVEIGEVEWSNVGMLTPVPRTPAPEAIHRFAMDITPGTTMTMDEDDEGYEEMLVRSCPSKSSYRNDDSKAATAEQHAALRQRLMAARRRTLQYAPRNASPLCASWKLSYDT